MSIPTTVKTFDSLRLIYGVNKLQEKSKKLEMMLNNANEDTKIDDDLL